MCDFSEDLIKEMQSIVRRIPTLIIGSGHSSIYGLPSTEDIGDYLLAEIPDFLSNSDSKKLWESIQDPIKKDFEAGLDSLSPNDKGVDELLQAIRRLITRLFREKCTEAEKRLISEGILASPENNALVRLMKILYEGCSPNASCIEIITTNYDTLIELFSDAAGLPIKTGFYGHRFRMYSQEKLEKPVFLKQTIAEKGKYKENFRSERSIRIIKPHGSINWEINNGKATEKLAYMDSDNAAVIVPGPFKYRDSLLNSLFDEIRACMNKVIKSSTAVIALGFGFNDDHLQNILRDRLNAGIQLLILTKEWTESIENFIVNFENNIIAIQQHVKGAICAWKGKKFLIHSPIWELNRFLKYVIE